jgi:hypothetical protein
MAMWPARSGPASRIRAAPPSWKSRCAATCTWCSTRPARACAPIINKFNATLDENKRLTHDLNKAQQRATVLMAEKSADANTRPS